MKTATRKFEGIARFARLALIHDRTEPVTPISLLEEQLRLANQRAEKAEAELNTIRAKEAKELDEMNAWMDSEEAAHAIARKHAEEEAQLEAETEYEAYQGWLYGEYA